MFEQAKWIWANRESKPDEYVDFLVKITAKAGHRYLLRLSCDSDYCLRCNEQMAAFGQYPDYPTYKIYDEIDLTDCLRAGENDLLFTVWYYGKDCMTYIRKEAGLLFEIEEDGHVILFSEEGIPCRSSAGFIPHLCRDISPQLGMTFAYDANRPATPFENAAETVGSRRLYPRPIAKLRMEKALPHRPVEVGSFRDADASARAAERMQKASLFPIDLPLSADGSVTLTASPGTDGVYCIIDLGCETSGFSTFSIVTDAACDIDIGWGEHLTDGRCRTAVRNFSYEYRAKAGRNFFLNPFRRLGCRYLQLFARAQYICIESFSICPVTYPVHVKAWKSGNALRDEIYAVCVNTLRQCMHDHYEDCPWREQALYTLDSRNQMLCGYYAFGETALPRASLELISHGVRADGLLSLCYPAGNDFPIPMFSLMYVIQMREYLDYTGDIAFVGEKYPVLQALLRVFLSHEREKGLIANFWGGRGDYWNFYEWSDGMSGRFGETERAIEAPLNAVLSLALQHMASIAQRLGHPAEAAAYLRQSQELNDAIAAYFYREEVGLFASFDSRDFQKYSVLTNSLCLLCGAGDHVDRSHMLSILLRNGSDREEIEVVPNTLSMNCFRFDALLRENRDVYRHAILSEIDRVYGNMLRAGATSFWETALGESDFDGAGSLCHGWSALPIYYYETLL